MSSAAEHAYQQLYIYLGSPEVEIGMHLSAQVIADRFGLSRSPVTTAFARLAEAGVLEHQPGRGYFLCRRPVGANAPSARDSLYRRLARARLDDALPEQVSERALCEYFDVSKAEIRDVMGRAHQEGWTDKRPGYGWQFTEILTTSASLEKSYRLRLAIEPALLLEPGFHLPRPTLNTLRESEQALLDGRIDTESDEQIYQRGVTFHETLAEASNNPFFSDTLRRVNRLRRLLAYRTLADRSRYYAQAHEHLAILAHIERGDMTAASAAMRQHLATVMGNLERLGALPEPAALVSGA